MARHQRNNEVGRHGKANKHGGGVKRNQNRHSANVTFKEKVTEFYLDSTDKLVQNIEKILGIIQDKFILLKDKIEYLFSNNNQTQGKHSSEIDEKFTDRAGFMFGSFLSFATGKCSSLLSRLKNILPQRAERFNETPESERFEVVDKRKPQHKTEVLQKTFTDSVETSGYKAKRGVFEQSDFSDEDNTYKPKRRIIEENITQYEEFSADANTGFDLSETVKKTSKNEENKKSLHIDKVKNTEDKKDFQTIAPKSLKSTFTGFFLGKDGVKKKQFSPKELPSVSQLEAELKWEKGRKSKNRLLRNSIFALITVAAVAVLVATLFLPVLQIYGSSMTPTLSEGNIVLSFKGSEFEQGDIISFYYNNKILVKRVIAFEGDWVNIDDDGNLFINNKKIDEPYIKKKALGDCDIKLPYQVPSGRIFVCGDHRETSVDSRSTTLGCVSEEQIVGKIVFRVWPLSKIGSIS